MIHDKRQIQIEASLEMTFSLIETMPNKFPVYGVLETKPFLFVRMLFVDGFRAAIDAVCVEKAGDELRLSVGDSWGPFTLTESEGPSRYWFTLRSLFFNCRTGYSLDGDGTKTTLHFDLIAESPSTSAFAAVKLVPVKTGILNNLKYLKHQFSKQKVHGQHSHHTHPYLMACG